MKNIYWRIFRTIIFLIFGIWNTIFVSAEAKGTFQNYLGYIILGLAIFEIFFFFNHFKKNDKSRN
jgi:hypothetical protein